MTSDADIEALKARIRDVPDFPKPGIVRGRKVSKVVAIESRGFILGGLVADRLGLGFVPVRKPGKLPARTRKASYALEYGTDSLEIHDDALNVGESVLIVDDVIATGGTARAAAELVEGLGARVSAYLFLIELAFLNGRAKLEGYDVLSLIRY